MAKPGLSTVDAFVDPTGIDEQLMLLDAEADTEDLSLSYAVFDTLAAAEPTWRELEARAVFTPYQRFDWVAALFAARGPDKGRLAITVVFQAGRPVALLPLVVTTSVGVRTARLIGWDIGNGDWMGVDPSFARRLDRSALDRLLAEIARLTGSDLMALHSQPERWGGLANPLLVLPHQPSPDHFYAAQLADGRLNAKRIRNLERGQRRLEELLGPVRLVRVETPQAVEVVHAEFLRQRGIRFGEMGVTNIFAEAWWQRFFKATASNGIGQSRPALVLHALYAGDQIIATSWGSFSGDHYSQYMNSTTDGPAAKYSLMGILLFRLVEDLHSVGVTSIDMGLGDFDYKLDWTDQQTSYDAVLALTAAGRIGGAVLRTLRYAKRAIKQDPILWRLATTIRSLLNRR